MIGKWAFLLLLLLAVCFEIMADVLFKKWALDGRNLLFYSGLLLYFVGTVFWAFSLRYELLSRAVTVFTVMNFVAVVLVGIMFFPMAVLSPISVELGFAMS